MVEGIDVRSLLTLPEGETLEFKAKAYVLSNQAHKTKFAKTLACLANTPRVGNAYIVLGVKKYRDGSFSLWGIDPDGIDDADLQGIAASLLEPCPRFSYQVSQVDGKYLGLIIIPRGHGLALPAVPKKTQSPKLIEGRYYYRHGSQNVPASVSEQAQIWSWFLGIDRAEGLRESSQGDPLVDVLAESRRSQKLSTSGSYPDGQLNAESLLHGPIEALGLNSAVEQAQHLTGTSPTDAARMYRDISGALRNRFPGYADQFELLHATALKSAGYFGTSHDVLMDLAIRDLFEKSEPQPMFGVAEGLQELNNSVDEVRRARGAAVTSFARWHETPGALQELADYFDKLGPDDPYTPYFAVLFAEAALADREFQVVLDREELLGRTVEHDRGGTALRIQIALADAGILRGWPDLADAVDSSLFSPAERTYVCLRAGRWYAWKGQLASAEEFYRRAVEFGASASLDLDVENALWSLTQLYTFPNRADELIRTNQLALSIQGSSSYVTVNSRTRQHAYQYLVDEKLPDAHLWSRHRLLESVRSGCLMDELESHAILARIYRQAGERHAALEHAVLSGVNSLAKPIAAELDAWPTFIADVVRSRAPWVRPVALTTLEHAGDLAPVNVSRSLAHELIDQLEDDADDVRIAPVLFRALWAIVLEATDDDLERLVRTLMRLAPRAPGRYLLTDPGVGLLAGRLYRFRPAARRRAASILAEMAVGGHTYDWKRALDECGEDIATLVSAFESVAERERHDLADPLSDLGHLNTATRLLWSDRLKFVEQHPLGERSEYSLLSRYDVPKQFLEEQEVETVDRYVQKLVAIGSDHHEAIVNRASALNSATTAVELLSTLRKRELFGLVRPLTGPEARVSALDEYQSRTLHPLSRFRISMGNVSDVRAAALRFLAWSAAGSEERSNTLETALGWLGSESEVLQRAGAAVLTIPHLLVPRVRSVELAGHPNPWVRQAAATLASTQQPPDIAILERLASDSHRLARIRVIYAIERIRDFAPEAYMHIGSLLRHDRSAIVRAIAADILDPP